MPLALVPSADVPRPVDRRCRCSASSAIIVAWGLAVPARRGSPAPDDGHRRVGAASHRADNRSASPLAAPCDNPAQRRARRPAPAHDRPIDATEGTPIDIIFLVERLESIIANGQPPAPDEQRRRRPGGRPRPDRRAAGRRPRGGPRGEADQLRGRADHREGPGRGRADRRQGPGAGRVPDRRAGADPAGRGREPADHRRGRGRRRGRPARRRRVRRQRPRRARGRRRQDAPEHQEGHRPARHRAGPTCGPARTTGVGPDDGLDDEAFEDVADDEGQPQPVRR